MAPPTALLRLQSSAFLEKSLLEEQNLEDSSPLLTLTLSCDDGHINMHRCLLSAASPYIQTLLVDEDPSLPSFIHVEGYSMSTVHQLMELVYTGKSSFTGDEEKRKLYGLMTTLGFPATDTVFKKSNTKITTDPHSKDLFKYVLRPPILSEVDCLEKEDDKENNEDAEGNGLSIPKRSVRDLRTVRNIRSRPTTRTIGSRRKKTLNNAGIVVQTKGKVPRVPSVVTLRTPRPKPAVRSAASRSKRRSRPAPKSPDAKNLGWNEMLECCTCFDQYDTELEVVEHLRKKCAASLKTYFDYSKRCCIVCERDDFLNLYTLLEHCEGCEDWKNPPPRGTRINKAPASSAEFITPPKKKDRKKRPPARRRSGPEKVDVVEPIPDLIHSDTSDDSEYLPIRKRPKTNPEPKSSKSLNKKQDSTQEIEVSSTSVIPSSPKSESSTSSSPFFPARFSRNGEWKFIRTMKYGESIFGQYANVNCPTKVIGVPASQVEEIKKHYIRENDK